MKRIVALSVLLAICAGAVSQAAAQPGGRGPGGPGMFGGGGGLLSLAQDEAVRKELEILDDQVQSLQKASQEIAEKVTALGNAKVAELLLPHQVKRLKEISLQRSLRFRGVSDALTAADVAAQLKLTDEQKKKLNAQNEENRTKMGELFRSGNREGMREKMESMRKESEEKALAVLSADQKAAFEKLKGKPFESGFGGGQRGGGNRPQRPAGGGAKQ